MVEQWFPKPKVRGSNPFFLDVSVKFTACPKAYSSVVERTAHNGLVVGSSPTELTES